MIFSRPILTYSPDLGYFLSGEPELYAGLWDLASSDLRTKASSFVDRFCPSPLPLEADRSVGLSELIPDLLLIFGEKEFEGNKLEGAILGSELDDPPPFEPFEEVDELLEEVDSFFLGGAQRGVSDNLSLLVLFPLVTV